MEKPWFQDTKTSCEKQAHYFVQIRKLQDELIHREQHNLINAMERLKQLSYPRKRPVIRNFVANPSSDHSSVQNFPARSLNLKKEAKHKVVQGKEQTELKPVSGKPLITINKSNRKKQEPHYHHFFVMPPRLSDRDIAKIVHSANATFPSEQSTYLLQPHLPSIPNVGRKTTFMVDNRLKLLTLAESEFCDQEEGSVSGMKKQLHTGKSRQRKKSSKSKSHFGDNASGENVNNSSKRNVLTFDVDPHDPSLFSHCLEDRKEEEQYETTPLPPPNSRPSSGKSRASREGERDSIQHYDKKNISKGSENHENTADKDNETSRKNEDAIPAEQVKKASVDPEVIVIANDNKVSDDQELSLVPVESKQDGSDLVNDSEVAANIN